MKNLKKFTILAVAAICVQLVCTNPANAFVSWTNSSGTAANFDWENGGSATGLFGDPTLVGGNTFEFDPDDFIAISSDGLPGEASDTLSFDLIAHDGVLITSIQIGEWGDYGILEYGSVDVYSALTAQNLGGSGVEYTSLVTNPLMPVTSGTGEWTASGGVSMNGWTHLRITLDNNLISISEPGSVAFIQKKIVGDSVAITIIPEPATLTVLAAGILCLKRKKY